MHQSENKYTKTWKRSFHTMMVVVVVVVVLVVIEA